MKKFVADFETCTWLENETFVWAWATCEIGNENNLQIGTSINTFIDFCQNEYNPVIYFHNAKFDLEFVIWWCFNNGFTHVTDLKDAKDYTFTTLIGDMGQFYSMTLYFKKRGRYERKVTFYDSLKIIPFSVKDIAKAFNLPISKLEIDYNKPRKRNHKLTLQEKEYIKNDVKIVAQALNELFKENLTKMTQGANALYDYKQMINKSKFNAFFPVIDKEVDEDLRKSYRRGIYLS